MTKLFLIFICLVNFKSYANEKILGELLEFRSNPKAFMNKELLKKQYGCSNILPDKKLNTDQQFVLRDQLRRQLMVKSKAGISANDQAQFLLDNPREQIFNIKQMDKQNLKSAELKNMPWSDDYWSLANGVLAHRYADRSMPFLNWEAGLNYYIANPPLQLLADGNADQLSPAEKYDLLLGDQEFSLTEKMWDEGRSYFERYGQVEGWMGICHGWAVASYMYTAPKKDFYIKDFNQENELHFFPADVKALGSLLWAKGEFKTQFVGGRCNDKNPTQNNVGRIISPKCFDNNPGTWHMAVVNQIGVFKRSFVMDATYDYEVWNQPVASYNYTYFNPQTAQEEKEIDKALILISEFKDDKFKEFRNKESVWVLGIVMEVKYVAEIFPSQDKDVSQFALNGVRYHYDLELDENFNIIGGEWYTNKHPDFLWTVAPQTLVETAGDRALGREVWDGKNKMSDKMQKAALHNSKSGVPTRKVVDVLFNLGQ